MKKHEEKVVVITGGNSGIGLAVAQRFVAEGAFVYITGRRQSELDVAFRRIGKHVIGVQGDVSQLADLDRLYATVKQHHNHIDVLFANSGLGEPAPLEAITERRFDTMFDVNVKGMLFTVQKALPLLRDGSSIILDASANSVTGTAGLSVYSATKAAIRAFARSWILDLQSRHIRVNVVSPGPINTPGLNEFVQEKEEVKASIATTVPLGRLGTPDDIAKAVSFLASDESSYINGIVNVEENYFLEMPPRSVVSQGKKAILNHLSALAHEG